MIVLAGCESRPAPQEADAVALLNEACDREVDRLVDAAQAHVDRFSGMSTREFVTEVGQPVDDLLPAVQRTYDQLALQGCDADRTGRRLAGGLQELDADGGIALAVADVVRDTLLGREDAGPRQLHVGVDDDLAAVAATAPVGSTLTIAAGDHHLSEPVLLAHHLVLVGAGSDQTRLISTDAEGAVIVLQTGALEFSGVTVLQDAPVATAAVQLASSAYDLRDLRITGATVDDGEGGIGLHLGAEERGQTVIAAELPGRLDRRVEDVEVVDNEGPGLLVTGSAAPGIHSSRFEANGGCGVCYFGEAGGSLADSQIVANDARGVMIVGTSDPVLRGNRIAGHPDAAVVIGEDAQPRLVGNVLEDNDIGVWVEGDAEVTIDSNDVHGEGVVGIAVTGNASGSVVGNRIAGLVVGVEVRGDATPTLSGNVVVDSEEAAIVLRDTAAPSGGDNRCEDSPLDIVVVDNGVEGSLYDGDCERHGDP